MLLGRSLASWRSEESIDYQIEFLIFERVFSSWEEVPQKILALRSFQSTQQTMLELGFHALLAGGKGEKDQFQLEMVLRMEVGSWSDNLNTVLTQSHNLVA